MADRLVQQNPRPTRSQHHRHRTRGRGYRLEIHEPLANRFASELQRLVARHQIRQRVTATHTGVALLTATVLLDEHRNIEAHQRPHIGGKLTFAGSDQHDVVYRGNARRHVNDARIDATRLAIHSLEPRNFILRRQRSVRIRGQIELMARLRSPRFHPPLATLNRDCARRA